MFSFLIPIFFSPNDSRDRFQSPAITSSKPRNEPSLWLSSPFGHLALSLAYLWKKQYEEALVETEQLLALNHPFEVFSAASAGILIALGQLEKASQLVEKALSLNTRLQPTAFRPLGIRITLTGRPEEAIAALKKSRNSSPADFDAHILLAAVYGELGRETEAQAEAAGVLRLNPNWSLEVWKQRVPYKDPATLERVFTALRKAGLKKVLSHECWVKRRVTAQPRCGE